MEQVFDELSKLMRDPFDRDATRQDLRARLEAAGLSAAEIALATDRRPAEAVANGPWQSSETCWDPGPDPFPPKTEP